MADILEFKKRAPAAAGGTAGDIDKKLMLSMSNAVDRLVNHMATKCGMRMLSLQVKYYNDPKTGELLYSTEFDGHWIREEEPAKSGSIADIAKAREGEDDKATD
jgi:hypothetical protein